LTIGAEEVARLVESGEAALLDVRSRAEYEGAAGYPCDPVQGHIPGAVHLDWEDLYAAAGAPHDADTIRALLHERGVEPDASPLVVYCHSGQRSAFAAHALRSAGLDVRNYEGSWHEWSRRPDATVPD
jgi:thiosulfate/3-mercaptopyruvate sulfurtransferase